MEYYTDFKKGAILSRAVTWLNPEDVMLRKIKQTQKVEYCMIPLLEGSKVIKTIETKSRMGLPWWCSG